MNNDFVKFMLWFFPHSVSVSLTLFQACKLPPHQQSWDIQCKPVNVISGPEQLKNQELVPLPHHCCSSVTSTLRCIRLAVVEGRIMCPWCYLLRSLLPPLHALFFAISDFQGQWEEAKKNQPFGSSVSGMMSGGSHPEWTIEAEKIICSVVSKIRFNTNKLEK